MPLLESLVRDARYALRVLGKTPTFTIAAVLTLALAIGINTAVFSIVDAVLLRPLPYPSGDRLALVERIVRAEGVEGRNTSVDGRTWEAVRDRLEAAERAVFSTWVSGVNLVARSGSGAAQARHVRQQRVGAGFFRTLGVRPHLGRGFTADEDRAGGPAAAVLSAPLWRSVFNADPSVVGRSIMLRGTPHTVVGVMPDGFHTGSRADLWTPLRPSTSGEGGGENYHVLLRLPEGASWAALEAQLSRLPDSLRPADPPAQVSFSFVGLQRGLSADLREPLLILWAAVGIVLLVACVNLAGLLLARGAQRSREIATRIALGSGRRAIVRQLFVESLVLALAGGTAGVAIGLIALDALTWLARDAYEIWQPVALDARSIGMAALLATGASVLLGLGPALQGARVNVSSSLSSARSIAGGSSRWPRRALVVAQVAMGTVLLVSAALLLRSFSHLRGLDPGFDARDLVAASLSLEDERYRTGDRVAQMFEATLAHLRGTPGVEAAAVALEVPYKRLLNLGFRHLDGPEAADGGAITNATYISSDFFDAMRIPVRRGRPFEERDRRQSPPVAIVSAAFVRTYFKGENPVGRRIAIAGAEREIVGEAGDVQVRPGWGDHGPLSAMPLVYLPVHQVNDGMIRLVHGWFAPTIVVRSNAGVADTAAAIRRALDSVDPLLPLASVQPISALQDVSLAPNRLLMVLLVALSGAAVFLAGIGLHGLIAASVVERTREIGIRLALGASVAQTMRGSALPGIILALAGIAAGLVASAAAIGMLRSYIWGVSPSDPLTFAGVAAILSGVAAAASVLPTLRILRLDAAQALRVD